MGCGSSAAASAENPAAPAAAPSSVDPATGADGTGVADTTAPDPPKSPSGPSTAEKKDFEQRIIDIDAKGQVPPATNLEYMCNVKESMCLRR